MWLYRKGAYFMKIWGRHAIMSEKNTVLGAIVFIVLYLVLSAVLIFVLTKKPPKKEKKCRFDERQIAAQGTAYQAAFWTMLCYSIVYAIVSGAMGIVWCDEFLGIFLGVIVGVTVFFLVCIFRDAYFSPEQSKTSAIVLLNLLCACQGILGINHLLDGTVIENGILTADSTQLFIFLMGLVADAALIVKHRMEKREEEEPEE